MNADLVHHHGHIDQTERRCLSELLPSLFADPTICLSVVDSGALAHIVAMGDTFCDFVELDLFVNILAHLLCHSQLISKFAIHLYGVV